MLRPYQQPLTEMFNSKATRFVWTLNGYLLLLVLFFVLGQMGKDIGLPWSNATPYERGSGYLLLSRRRCALARENADLQRGGLGRPFSR